MPQEMQPPWLRIRIATQVIVLLLPLAAHAVSPANSGVLLSGTAVDPGISSKDGAVQQHESDGPMPSLAGMLRRQAQDTLHASLEAGAFADEAREAREALQADPRATAVPASLEKAVAENEAVAKHAAALAQARAQASWDAVAHFESEVETDATFDDATRGRWHDKPLSIEWSHVSAELFNPSLHFHSRGVALVAFRQQIRNQQRCAHLPRTSAGSYAPCARLPELL